MINKDPGTLYELRTNASFLNENNENNMNSIRFGCTALSGVNKVGNIKKDENGYYEMIVGALNVFNSSGMYYVYEKSRELFEQSSQLQRRVARGALRGEYGHPKAQIGQSDEAFARRILTIDEGNVCCHHKEIVIDFDKIKDERGQPIIAIVSKVCPSGPLGHVLERSLNNKDENVCFSIRSFTKDFMDRGVYKRILQTVVTFDYVNEPGIAIANKFMSPALESYGGDVIVTRGTIERAVNEARNSNGIGTESVILTADELFKNMGWAKNDESNIQSPVWSGW